MIHENCLTYFNAALRRCEHCGMLWCPRCRMWFRDGRAQLSEDGKHGR